MYCMKCGKENLDSSTFCESCGAKLVVDEVQTAEIGGTASTMQAAASQVSAPNSSNIEAENPKRKKLIIACVVAGVIVVALAIVLTVLCTNYYSNNESGAENQNAEATQEQNNSASNNASNANNAAASNNANTSENVSASAEAQSSEAQSSDSQPQAQQEPEPEAPPQSTPTPEQQLAAEGCTVIAQGEVRQHYDTYYNGDPNITYYIWLDEPCTVTGFQPGGFKTDKSQAIESSGGINGQYSSAVEAQNYLSTLVGQRVLVGFIDGTQDVGFNTDVPCSLTQHTQSQCDLLNAGRVSGVKNMQLIVL